jgi:hypothetical protein
MSIFATPIQSAVYNRLSAELSTTVYDDVPDLPAKLPDENFPYIVIGEDLLSTWDTDDTLGGSVLTTLHVWSRYNGKKELKEIMAAIYTALNRQAPALSASGFRFVDCLFEFAQILDQSDGKTRQGICRYRITIEKE